MLILQIFQQEKSMQNASTPKSLGKQKKRDCSCKQSLFGLSGGNRTHSLSLRRRLRYPITLRKDFNVLKVIKRNKNYKIYTDFYTDLIFYVVKTQYIACFRSVIYHI